MTRTLDEVMASLPRDRQERIEARYQELKEEVESLRQLRRMAGKAQSDVATALNIKQPSVSKIEAQADMYLSTLRGYVEAVGGELDLVVRLPSRPAIHLRGLRDLASVAAATPPKAPSRVKPRRREAPDVDEAPSRQPAR